MLFISLNKSSYSRSLGLLNYIRIWHDNSGRKSSASWFLKNIIVRDVQTNERFYFIAQKWFAVEKDDGRVRFDRFVVVFFSSELLVKRF